VSKAFWKSKYMVSIAFLLSSCSVQSSKTSINETSKSISTPLAHIFNISMQTGKLPDNWKKANVTPLHKKGPKNLVENYRPISLTSIVCKTMEKYFSTYAVTL
jgi:hypothetical protein